MLVVRGTKKLRDRIKGTPLGPDDVATNVLGDWFATALFWRPQVALLLNEQTFLPVFMPLAPTATLLSRIPEAIGSVLQRHGVEENFVAAEMEAMADVRLGPTNNRSVLGVMNEFAFHGEHVWRDGRVDLGELSVLVSGIILGPLHDRHGSPDRELAAITGVSAPARGRHLRAVPASGEAASKSTSATYQLKVTILDTKPPIWRRVLVPANTTLDRLHEILQAAFGWWNCHLHEFEFGRVRYGMPDRDDWDPPKDERRARLDSVANEGSRFVYVYDFGDNWRHQVVVEKVLTAEPGIEAPSCIDGRRACPPEDCGGTWGYYELLETLANPKDPDYAERLEWVGGHFDPEPFDPTQFADNLKNGRLAAFDD